MGREKILKKNQTGVDRLSHQYLKVEAVLLVEKSNTWHIFNLTSCVCIMHVLCIIKLLLSFILVLMILLNADNL